MADERAGSSGARRVGVWLGVAVVLVVATAVVAYKVGQSERDVLAPATVPPVVGICSAQLSYSIDGTAHPLRCSNGDINRLAWAYYANLHLKVMTLGPHASSGDVTVVVAGDLSHAVRAPLECGGYELAVAYYGWHFASDPTSAVVIGGCANTLVGT